MKDKRHFRQWKGGKGSADRTSDRESYRLGMELLRVSQEYGKDSDEYRAVLKQWEDRRNA